MLPEKALTRVTVRNVRCTSIERMGEKLPLKGRRTFNQTSTECCNCPTDPLHMPKCSCITVNAHIAIEKAGLLPTYSEFSTRGAERSRKRLLATLCSSRWTAAEAFPRFADHLLNPQVYLYRSLLVLSFLSPALPLCLCV